MSLSISAVLSQIPDPRVLGLVDHPLSALLRLILLGKLCGRQTMKAAWRMGRNMSPEELKKLGFTKGKAPAYTTITETIKQVDYTQMQLVFASCVRSFSVENEEHIAVDGKVLCGSKNDDLPAVKLLSAFSSRLRGVVGEIKVESGFNEISAMLDLLEKMDVDGMIITGDAAFAQKNICCKVVEKKADFVFTVKDNQKALKNIINSATEAVRASLSPRVPNYN